MGLLGGFKGRLIGKEKKTKETKNQVVCVKFSTFSEFDDAIPSCSNQNPGPNEVIRERRRPTKADVKSLFPLTANGSAPNAATSPVGAARSPVNAGFSPVNAAISPVNAAISPVNAAISPVNTATSPVNAATSPVNGAISPVNAAFSPVNAATSPVNGAISPVNAVKPSDNVINATNLSVEEIYGINLIPPNNAAKSTKQEANDQNVEKPSTKETKSSKTKKAAAKPPPKEPASSKSKKEAAKSPPKEAAPPKFKKEAAKSPPKESAPSKSKKKAAKPPPKEKDSSKSKKEAAKSPKGLLKLAIPGAKAQAPPPPSQTPAKFKKSEPTPVKTETLQFPLQDSDSEDDGNFKIHFATKVNPDFADLSDDDEWARDQVDLSPITYSSQATRIFFEGDEAPMMMRPRNIKINDDNFSDGSSASA